MSTESDDDPSWPTGEQFAGLAVEVLDGWLQGYYELNGRSWRIRRTTRGWEVQDENSNELWEFEDFKITTRRF